jgi:hypothetical protein
VVERKHQHILNVARSLYFQSHIPISYWGEFVKTVVFLINGVLTPNLQNCSPYSILFSKEPNLIDFRSFGCLTYASTLPSTRDKFTPRAIVAAFIGYPAGYKGYKLLDLTTHKIFISRDVQFYETIFPLKGSTETATAEDIFHNIPVPTVSEPTPTQHPIDAAQPSSPTVTSPNNPEPADNSQLDVPQAVETHPTSSTIPAKPILQQPTTSTRKSSRVSKPSEHLKDFHCYLLNKTPYPTPY